MLPIKFYLLLALPALLLSQRATAQQWRFGAKAGLNYTAYTGWAVNGPRGRTGLNGGGAVRYTLDPNRRWELQAELLYSVKGIVWGSYRYASGSTHLDQERLHYLDLPLLTRFQTHGLVLEAGPQLSTALAGRLDYGSYPDGEAQFRRHRYAKVQLGYAAGLGYELTSGPSLTLRYARDLTGIMRGDGFQGQRFVMLQAQLGYWFGGGE